MQGPGVQALNNTLIIIRGPQPSHHSPVGKPPAYPSILSRKLLFFSQPLSRKVSIKRGIRMQYYQVAGSSAWYIPSRVMRPLTNDGRNCTPADQQQSNVLGKPGSHLQVIQFSRRYSFSLDLIKVCIPETATPYPTDLNSFQTLTLSGFTRIATIPLRSRCLGCISSVCSQESTQIYNAVSLSNEVGSTLLGEVYVLYNVVFKADMTSTI